MTENDTVAAKKPRMRDSARPSRRQPSTYGASRVRFFALQTEIRAELSRGYTVKMIYDKHQTALGCSYKSLARYIHRYASDARPQLILPLEDAKRPRDSPTRDHSGHADPATLRRLIKG